MVMNGSPDVDSELSNDCYFRTKNIRGIRPFLTLPVEMITSAPFDYMQSVLLGVT